jgi:membrane protein DedA with SNARE-associated domain
VLDWLLHQVEILGPWAYAIVFLITTLESSAFLGLLAPGESVVLFAGFLAEREIMNLRVLIPLVAVGAILGDTIGYEIGRHLGRPWLIRHGRKVGVRPKHLERAQAFFEKHGPKAVFFGRWVGFARALVPFIAGSTRMRYRTFLLYNAMAAVSWTVGTLLIGYFAGASWRVVEKWIGRSGLIIGALGAAIVIGLILWRRKKHAEEEAAESGHKPGPI